MVDPSHCFGTKERTFNNLPQVFIGAGQGLLAGATNILMDYHPSPLKAKCDSGQALDLSLLAPLVDYSKKIFKTSRLAWM